MEVHKRATAAANEAGELWTLKDGQPKWDSISAYVPADTAADMAAAMRGATGNEPSVDIFEGEAEIDVKLPTFQRDRAVRTIAQCAVLNGGWVS